MTDSTDPQPFPPRDRLFALIASIPGSGTFDWCSPARALLDEIEAAAPPAADRADELAKHVTRAIFALKSPAPPGSEHYRSGWDDGLEAAIDAARDAVLRRVADEAQQAETQAHPAEHTWAAELYDPLTEEWVPGTRYFIRDRAVSHLTHARAIGPTWRDGTPTQRRLVRATTTYTVEDAAPPAVVAEPGKENSRG